MLYEPRTSQNLRATLQSGPLAPRQTMSAKISAIDFELRQSIRLRPGNDHLPSLSSFHITGNGNTPADSPTGGRSTPCDSPPSINSFDLDMPSSLSVLSSVDVTHSPSIKPSPRLTLRSLAPSSPSCFVCVDLAECQGIDVGGISPLLATATRSISFSDSSVSVRSAPGKEKSAASKNLIEGEKRSVVVGSSSKSTEPPSAAVYPSPSPVFDSGPWSRGACVGVGSFGRVYRCLHSRTGEMCVMKEIACGASSLGSQEARLLASLKHDNIVKFLGMKRTAEHLQLFMEYVSGGSLRSVLEEFGSFEEVVIARNTKRILEGLVYLHDKGVVHGNLKCANVLVSTSGCLKIGDFGSASAPYTRFNITGTVPYMAPEVIAQRGFGVKVDIWSLGCAIIEMATGAAPWSQFTDKSSLMYHVCCEDVCPELPSDVSPLCASFLRDCFSRDPAHRPSASTLLQHPWITDVGVNHSGSASGSQIPSL